MNRVAAIQMASSPSVNSNLIEAERLIKKAVDAGAKLVVLPENFAIMGKSETDKVKLREAEGDGPIQTFLAEQARRHGIWLVGGTIPLASASDEKVYASALLFDATGEQVARYDKVHLFDVRITESDEKYTESETIEAGRKVVVADTPFGKLGMAICYDLRFPELFRQMLQQGAEIIALPSAFTAITGRAHWEPLVRARAIENLSYLIASAQGGYHANGRETYGHSMIVDPWGVIMDELPRGSGVVIADIDRNRLQDVRRNFPALEHRRISCTI